METFLIGYTIIALVLLFVVFVILVSRRIIFKNNQKIQSIFAHPLLIYSLKRIGSALISIMLAITATYLLLRLKDPTSICKQVIGSWDKMPEDIADIELPELKAIAAAHGVHPAVICIKWAVQRGASPIPFSLKEKNYTMNLKCVTEDPLTEEEMETIRSLDKNNRLIKGHVFLWEGAKDWHDLWDEDGVIVK